MKSNVDLNGDTEAVVVLSLEDRNILEEAVDFINRKTYAHAKSLIEIGQYLLDHFFKGDPEKVSDRAPRKGVSLRKLAEHPDILMSFMTLHNAVQLAIQEKLFSSPKYKRLCETHKLLLFSVPDEKKKLEFAEMIVREDLSVRGLRELLISNHYIQQRGRNALVAETASDRRKNVHSHFFKPIENLVKYQFDIDAIALDSLSKDHIQALRILNSKIQAILAKVDRRTANCKIDFTNIY